MTPVEMCHLTTLLASKYPSARVQESSLQFWRALLADVDDTDALFAFIRLVCRQSDIALADICAEAHRIQGERLARYPESDTDLKDADPDQARHYRTGFPAVLTSLLGRRVPCRAGRQLSALEQHDVGPAGLRQVVEHARTDDASADDDDLG